MNGFVGRVMVWELKFWLVKWGFIEVAELVEVVRFWMGM
jgi:hypothetical protein